MSPSLTESLEPYVRSYLFTRTAVGAVGIAVPFGLFIGDAILGDTKTYLRGSSSASYHSPMRDLLVGAPVRDRGPAHHV